MSVDGGHQELPTVSTGRTLSAPPSDADSAATSNYALITGDSNNVQTPSHHTTMITHDQNGIHSTFSFSQQPTTSATRVKIDVGNYQQHPLSADDVCGMCTALPSKWACGRFPPEEILLLIIGLLHVFHVPVP